MKEGKDEVETLLENYHVRSKVRFIKPLSILFLVSSSIAYISYRAVDGSKYENKKYDPLLMQKHSNKEFYDRFNEEIVEKYVAWHNRTLVELEKSGWNQSGVKFLLWKGNHGIGDRYRAITNVFLSAIVSERFLLLDWGRNLPVSEIIKFGVGTNFSYDSRMISQKSLENSYQSRVSTIEDLEHILSNDSFVVSVANSRPNLEIFIKVHEVYPSLKFSKVFSKIVYPEIKIEDIEFFHFLLPKILKPTQRFLQVVDSLKQNNLYKFGDEKPSQLPSKYITIHVRYGKGIGENSIKRFDFISKNLDEMKLSSCIATKAAIMARKAGLTPGVYFLATDTPEIRHALGEALAREDKEGILFFGKWSLKHVQKLNSDDEKDLKILIYTFGELEIMSKGVGMINLYSGFADIAKWMGNIKNTKMISDRHCSKQWTKEIEPSK